MTAEVAHFKITRRELKAANVPALRELFGLEALPLAPSTVEVELKGVSVAVVNALRRVITDEMLGHALQVPSDGFDTEQTTEVFMLPQFVNQRIALLPLRPQIPSEVVEALRLGLDVANQSASVLAVYAGDLEVTAGAMSEPLFNPTFKLCELQPGKRIVIRGIYISSGYGRDNGAYIVANRAAYRHLDIPQHSEAETHDAGGVAADWSGYKVSCLVANPRHHLLTAVLPATSPNASEVRAVFADACANIRERLRLILTTVERRSERLRANGASGPSATADRGVQYTVFALDGGLSEAMLQVPGETYTIGALLCRAVNELTPDIANVAHSVVAHENRLNLSLRHTGDVTSALLGAVKHSLAIFDTIQRGVMTAR